VTLGWTKRGELIKFKVKADRDRSAATLGVVSCRAWTPSVVRVLLAQAGTCLRSCPCQKPSRLHPFTPSPSMSAGRYWKDALPGRTLAHIVPGDIARYMAQRSQEVAPATINRALSFLRRVFNVAIADGKADRNPVRAVKFFKENNERVRFLTEDEERLLAAEKVKKRGLEGHRQKRVGPSTALRAVPLPQKSRGGMSLHPHSLKLRGFPSPR